MSIPASKNVMPWVQVLDNVCAHGVKDTQEYDLLWEEAQQHPNGHQQLWVALDAYLLRDIHDHHRLIEKLVYDLFQYSHNPKWWDALAGLYAAPTIAWKWLDTLLAHDNHILFAALLEHPKYTLSDEDLFCTNSIAKNVIGSEGALGCLRVLSTRMRALPAAEMKDVVETIGMYAVLNHRPVILAELLDPCSPTTKMLSHTHEHIQMLEEEWGLIDWNYRRTVDRNSTQTLGWLLARATSPMTPSKCHCVRQSVAFVLPAMEASAQRTTLWHATKQAWLLCSTQQRIDVLLGAWGQRLRVPEQENANPIQNTHLCQDSSGVEWAEHSAKFQNSAEIMYELFQHTSDKDIEDIRISAQAHRWLAKKLDSAPAVVRAQMQASLNTTHENSVSVGKKI